MIVSSPVRDEEFRKAWSAQHPYCQACGLHAREAQVLYPQMPLSVHHIIKPGRSDEACNLLKLCLRCHDLAELKAVRVKGTLLPKLPWPVCCSLKAIREAEAYDPVRLATLAKRLEIELPPIPRLIEAEFRRNRPWDGKRFASDECLTPSE
jgi:hypothetical protein